MYTCTIHRLHSCPGISQGPDKQLFAFFEICVETNQPIDPDADFMMVRGRTIKTFSKMCSTKRGNNTPKFSYLRLTSKIKNFCHTDSCYTKVWERIHLSFAKCIRRGMLNGSLRRLLARLGRISFLPIRSRDKI